MLPPGGVQSLSYKLIPLVIVILYFAMDSLLVDPDCPQTSAWVKFKNKCYREYIHGLNWSEAWQACKRLKGRDGDNRGVRNDRLHMLTVKSKAEHEFIVDHFARVKKDRPIWLNLKVVRPKTHSGLWRWRDVDTWDNLYQSEQRRSAGSLVEWGLWAKANNEPDNNGDEKVALMDNNKNFEWSDFRESIRENSVNKKVRLICEYRYDKPPNFRRDISNTTKFEL